MGRFFVVMIVLCLLCSIVVQGSQATEMVYPDILRLHILANSDLAEDQEVKLAVRDVLLSAYGPVLKEAGTAHEVYKQLEACLPQIQSLAKEETKRQGLEFPVSVQLGQVDFPARSYGGTTLPAGRYEALQIFIGEGAGANWWCVLFPPLCLVEGTASTGDNIEDEESPPEVRFKVWELLGGQ